MKIWNFKKQNLDEGVEPPISNGLCGKKYQAVNISYNRNDGETVIEYIKEKEKETK